MNLPTQKLIRSMREWLRGYTAAINHNSVRSGVFAEGEISVGYFFVLNVANLIALCGLLMNSSPVMTIVPGTGLGLYLSRKLAVEVLKGDITVTSEFGRGSRFVIRIPSRLV